MRSLLFGSAALFGLLALSSCATYDPCTRDWFARQADDIQRDFVRRNRAPVRRMRDLQSELRSGFEDGVDPFAILALASAKRDVRSLVSDFQDRVVPRARGIAATCELDEGYDLIVDSFLAQNGVDARLVELLDLFGQVGVTPDLSRALAPRGTWPQGADALQGAPASRDRDETVRGRPAF